MKIIRIDTNEGHDGMRPVGLAAGAAGLKIACHEDKPAAARIT